MKTTPAKIQLQLLVLILNKKGRQENCVHAQAISNQTKLRVQLFQKRPNHLTPKPPHVSQSRSRHRLLDHRLYISHHQSSKYNPHRHPTA